MTTPAHLPNNRLEKIAGLWLKAGFAVGLCGALAACGGGDSLSPTPAPAPTPAPVPTPTPTPTPAALTGNAIDCFNPQLLTPGVTFRWELASTSPALTMDNDYTAIRDGASFNGVNGLIESTVVTAVSSGAVRNVQTGKAYAKLETLADGRPLVRRYGQTGASGLLTISGVYTPALEDRSFLLRPGETESHSETLTTTTSTAGAGSSSATVTSTVATTYIGQERITTPAGTFNACKFQTVTNGGTPLMGWRAVRNGLTLAVTQITGTTTTTLYATSNSHINETPLAALPN